MSLKKLVSDRSWSSVRQEFNTIIQNLKCMMDETNNSSSGVNRLQQECAKEITAVLERQLPCMSFFTEGDSDPSVEQKRKYAVLTNLGAESDFAALDNKLRRLGGSTTLQIISNKHIIRTNKLFSKERWAQLPDQEKRKKWSWVRGSKEARRMKEMEKEFYDRISAAEKLSIKAKDEQKRSAVQKVK